MPAFVTLTYNPYFPQLKVLVNGQKLSGYSRLTQYSTEDMWVWHSVILEEIYQEIRDSFRLNFIGRKEDGVLFKLLCDKYPECLGFSFEPFPVDYPLQKRLGLLNQYLKMMNILHPPLTTLSLYFAVSPELYSLKEELQTLDIQNRFCKTKITVRDNLKDWKFTNSPEAFLFVLTSSENEGIRQIRNISSGNPIFVFCLDNLKGFSIDEKMILIHTSKAKLISAIFEVMLWDPLLIPFRNCYSDLLKTCSADRNFQKIAEVEHQIYVQFDTVVELGKSNPLTIDCPVPVVRNEKLHFNILDPSIATTDGFNVFGHREGQTKLEVYRVGANLPFQTIPIRVIRRNRIKKIVLDEDNLVLGEGDHKKLGYSISPVNADNISTIEWKSTNPSIATVDKKGYLTCKKQGECKIYCLAENISAQMNLKVLPYLTTLKVHLPDEADVLQLTAMDEYELEIECTPENALDNSLIIKTSNYDVVNIAQNRVQAKYPGQAEITITNVTGTHSCVIPVVVKKLPPKLFRMFRKKQ